MGFVLTARGSYPGFVPINQEAQTQIIGDTTPADAYALIQNNKENNAFVIIDVRTPEEYQNGFIKDAINLDFYSETFRDELDKLDKDKTYLIYCRSGRRSGLTIDVMKEIGFREAYNLVGGLVQWEAEGLPIVK